MLVTYVPFNTNKLSRVTDATANAAGFPGMSTAQSYGYDSNGRLVQDPQEGLAIDWLPFDKPWKVTKTNGSVFEYGYDALHNRVEKITLSNNERTAYIRDASGNIVALYEYKNGLWFWREQHLYGIDRVGVEKIVSEVIVTQVPIYVDCPPATPAPCIVGDMVVNTIQYQYTGTKYYELTNHLGNVMVVVTDQVSAVGTLVLPTVVSATDYFPFGMEMTGRIFSSDSYSFGFNGKIEDSEILSNGRWQDYGFRAYRNDICRFVSVDPLKDKYPELTTYQFASNTPIQAIDLDGLEAATARTPGVAPSPATGQSFKSYTYSQDPNGQTYPGTSMIIVYRQTDVYNATQGIIANAIADNNENGGLGSQLAVAQARMFYRDQNTGSNSLSTWDRISPLGRPATTTTTNMTINSSFQGSTPFVGTNMGSNFQVTMPSLIAPGSTGPSTGNANLTFIEGDIIFNSLTVTDVASSGVLASIPAGSSGLAGSTAVFPVNGGDVLSFQQAPTRLGVPYAVGGDVWSYSLTATLNSTGTVTAPSSNPRFNLVSGVVTPATASLPLTVTQTVNLPIQTVITP